MLQPIITQFLSGFSVVAILVIASLGLAIIFGVAGGIKMDDGKFMMVGRCVAAVVGQLGGNTFIAIPVAFVVVGLIGLAIERGIIRWIYDRPLETLLATWGVGIGLQVIVKLIFGPELYYVGAPKMLDGAFRMIGLLPFPYYRLFLIILAIVMMALTFYVIFKTDFGLKVRGVRRNRGIAGCLGGDTAKVDMMIFTFGSGLAGVGGGAGVHRTPMIPLWALVIGVGIVLAIGTYPYYGQAYVMSLLGKFLCYAIFALSIDLIWGFAGILSLGQAVYFGIGAYFVALSLKINYALVHPTRYGGKIPDFMEWNGLTELPGFMEPLVSLLFAIAMALVVPTLFAFLFGVITFKRHIYGVYCAVITLAESLILQDGIIEYQAYTGGFNGITDYSNYGNAGFLWFILAITVLCFIAGRLLTHSRVGTVLKSIRDNDVRAEFMGYNVANYRIFVFCVSAFMAAAAGAMYAAWVGLVSFLDAGPVFSIEAVIWTAVGGGATLIGPFVGAFLVKGAEFFLSGVLQWTWQLIMGGLFIFVVLVMRDGVVGTIANWVRRRQKGSMAQIVEEADQKAHDRQADWRPESAPGTTREILPESDDG